MVLVSWNLFLLKWSVYDGAAGNLRKPSMVDTWIFRIIFRIFIFIFQKKNTVILPLTQFSNNTVYFGILICPFSTKSLLHLHGFLLTRLFFQSLKKQHKQRTLCNNSSAVYLLMTLYASEAAETIP